MGSEGSKQSRPWAAKKGKKPPLQRQDSKSRSQKRYTKADFKKEALLVKSDLLGNEDRTDNAFWFVRVLDRALNKLGYPYGILTELMPTCATSAEVGFSRLHSLGQDPNKIPFPLPGDVSPDELREWGMWPFPACDQQTTWDCIELEDIQDDNPIIRWSSTNPMSRYYFNLMKDEDPVSTPCPQGKLTLDLTGKTPRQAMFSGEAARAVMQPDSDESTKHRWSSSNHVSKYYVPLSFWEPRTGRNRNRESPTGGVQPGLIRRDITTFEQESIWEKRQNYRNSDKKMVRRRLKLATYFEKTYHYNEQYMEPFQGFADKMEHNAEEFQALIFSRDGSVGGGMAQWLEHHPANLWVVCPSPTG